MIPYDIHDRARRAVELLEKCAICPRACGVNRLEDERGFCGVGRKAIVSSFGPHYGEEPPLVGHHGSGTIFFAGCNLGCLFCQNYDISHLRQGEEVDAGTLAAIMFRIRETGCHNVNFVTPTHVYPQILESLSLLADEGFNLPLVYNSGGYDGLDALKALEGVMDIYMPDFKYMDEETAREYSNAPGYPEIAMKALKEMQRQVGDLEIDSRGIALRGLLIRHLVLPEGLEDSERIFAFIAEDISRNSYVNIMEQYRPCFKASTLGKLGRHLKREEHAEAIKTARKLGLHRGF